jgi:hypothetical protein
MEIKFIKKTNLLEEPSFQNFYATFIDGYIVVGSGSHQQEKAKEKYDLIVANAGITKLTEELDKKILE